MNATQLLADIKRKGQLTADDGSFNDLDILDVATKELQTVIVPKILSVREHYFETYVDFTVTSAREYRIPSQAIGNKLLQVEYIETIGANQSQRDLNLVSPINFPRVEGFYVRNNTMVLTPYAPAYGLLRMHFAMRPGALTETLWTVGSVDNVFGIDTLTGSPSIGDIVNVQKKTSPYEYVVYDQVINSISGSQFSLPLGVYTGIEVGDIVTYIKTTSPTKNTDPRPSYFPQIPEELHDWLALRTVINILGDLGHTELQQKHMNKLTNMERDILSLITPRVDGSPKVVICGELLGWEG